MTTNINEKNRIKNNIISFNNMFDKIVKGINFCTVDKKNIVKKLTHFIIEIYHECTGATPNLITIHKNIMLFKIQFFIYKIFININKKTIDEIL